MQHKGERTMLKKLTIVLLLTICVSVIAEAAKDAAPARFSLCPGFGWPKNKDVTGVNFGLIGDMEKGKVVTGADWSLFVSLTNNIKGTQSAFVNISKDSEFAQGGIVNIAEDSKGTQWGLINFGKNMEGLQVGLINIMDNGWLPFFIFFNFSK